MVSENNRSRPTNVLGGVRGGQKMIYFEVAQSPIFPTTHLLCCLAYAKGRPVLRADVTATFIETKGEQQNQERRKQKESLRHPGFPRGPPP